MEIIKIIGENYLGSWHKQRTSCRTLVIKDGKLLLTFEKNICQYMIPGGGKESDESDTECAEREVSEETGYIVKTSECVLKIDEYYEDSKYFNKYYLGTVVGQTSTHLTQREKENGAEPVWVDIDTAINIFSEYEKYEDPNEMKRGLYLREYTALCKILKNNKI